ncbi:hypothetical protein FB45DRAFT_1024680 [Roridomyces roridus]|uniref:Uncharacterized protein n=1 Tax=Roridomyces roridus TaxID=1738132 RepID=A0AAD7C1C3_9AGAR|nr:hypothetical protein FB45DRAFT_1024680 [Roridomyces roridus]
MSTTQNPFRGFGVYKRPAHLTLSEFEDKYQKGIDALIALPVVQRIIIKYELKPRSQCISTTDCDAALAQIHSANQEDIIIVIVETRTREDFLEYLGDPAVQKIIGCLDDAAIPGGGRFSARVVTKLQK